ncbi:MAG: HAD-IIA family hydrolase [Candidatus Helarchaeota archaeon]|nr:HAD-IIA family hydrolase [Candidatus Helarchaeota archaeon]
MNLEEFQLFIFDLDGVIYLGNEPISGAQEVLEKLAERKKDVFFLTNNSTRTRTKVCKKLLKMGIQVQENQIITSAYATAQYLNQRHPKATVYIIGEEGLINEFKNAGFDVISDETAGSAIEFVIVGLDRDFTYQKVAFALAALNKGAKFIATNTDPTLPTEHGNLPGAGTMVAALSTAAYCDPMITIGKPNPFMIEFILKSQDIKPSAAVIIGDRYSTDVKAGLNAHIGTILVKTGTGMQELKLMPASGPKPDLILDSVADLLQYL